MPKPLTRRNFLNRIGGTLFAILGISSGGYVYAHRIEPSMLEINHLDMPHTLIPKGFNGKKIVQFSDTHLGFQYNLKQLNQLAGTINDLAPDLILFTGDLMDEPNKFMQLKKLQSILQRLHAPLGKYCIFGNHDHGGYGSEIYRDIMEASGFTVLLNQSVPIHTNDGSRIYLTGIDDRMLGKPDLPLALKNVPINTFSILLSHAPDVADSASHYPVHWQLSGHSHGGQVKIPYFGALVIPPFARIYQEGLYKIGDSKAFMLYVNRGLGTTRLPFRFMAKPELTVFTLKSI